jgi:hypothetical protein
MRFMRTLDTHSKCDKWILNSNSIILGLLLVKKICVERPTTQTFGSSTHKIGQKRRFSCVRGPNACVDHRHSIKIFYLCVDFCVSLRNPKNGFLIFSENLLIVLLFVSPKRFSLKNQQHKILNIYAGFPPKEHM